MRTEMELGLLDAMGPVYADRIGLELGVSELDPRNTEFEEHSTTGTDEETEPR